MWKPSLSIKVADLDGVVIATALEQTTKRLDFVKHDSCREDETTAEHERGRKTGRARRGHALSYQSLREEQALMVEKALRNALVH